MRRYKYDDALSAGTVAAGGTIGILIPPSGALIVYGLLSETDIAKLFMAGLIPGIFPLRGDQEFLGERMKDAGYQTFYIGKWHLQGGPKPGIAPKDRRFGFDRFVGFNPGHSYLDGIFFRDTDQPYRCRRYKPDYQTDHMIDFIDEAQQDPEKPFRGYLSNGPCIT